MSTQVPALELPAPRSRRGLTTDVLGVIFAAAVVVNGAVMIWLWLRDGGITQLHSAGDVETSVGRVTGLLGAYLALVQVLLLARLPPLERRIGLDRLTVWHRINGKLVIYLVVAHVVFITIGYAGTGHTGVFSQFSQFLSGYPGMITATVGTGLMILTVLSSLVIARRRLPYELWYGVHLTVYAGIYLAYLHEIPSGNELVDKTVQDDWWLSLYIATLALLVLYRVLLPALQFQRSALRVTAVQRLAPNVATITLSGRGLDRLHAAAGQFLLWRFLGRGLWWQSHPFSLSALPRDGSLRITVKAVGGYTRRLLEVPVGTRVYAEGPFGRLAGSRGYRRHVVLIAGGIGVTPLRAILEDLHGVDVTFIYRVRDRSELVLRDELAALVAERGGRLHELVGDHGDPEFAALLAPARLRELTPELGRSDVFLCGPPAMMRHTLESLAALGVPRHQIHTESFAFAG